MSQKQMTVVLDPSEEEPKQTSEPKPTIGSPFALRPVSQVRSYVIHSMSGLDIEPLSECPSASEMDRLRRDVMNLTVEQLASVLKTPVGPVAAWLDEDSGMKPTPEIVSEPPEFMWRHWLALWSLAYAVEKETQA